MGIFYLSLIFGQQTKDPLLNDILAAFRDTRLPKPISSKLHIPYPEKIIEEGRLL